jgi:hypothetical protein
VKAHLLRSRTSMRAVDVPCTALLAVLLAGPACRSDRVVAAEHQRANASLQSTTVMAAEAWLSGVAPGAYTRATLESTARLLDKQRTELSSHTALLATEEGARLSQSEEQLSRTLAALVTAVGRADAATTRRYLGQLPGNAAATR